MAEWSAYGVDRSGRPTGGGCVVARPRLDGVAVVGGFDDDEGLFPAYKIHKQAFARALRSLERSSDATPICDSTRGGAATSLRKHTERGRSDALDVLQSQFVRRNGRLEDCDNMNDVP